MNRLVAGWALAVLCIGLAPAARAADPEPELITDRPDFTESSVVVPRGSLQLESGFTWEDDPDGAEIFNLPELLLRWGVLERTELRLGLPQYFRVRGAGRTDGFGDTYLGLKHQLGPWRGWDFAIIPAVSLPTGARAFTSDAVDPEVKLTWARDLAERWSLSGMFAFYWPTEGERRNFTWQNTLSLAYSLGERWGTFLEYANAFPKRGGDQHLLHHGYTYAVTQTSQLDMHFGFGLSDAAPDFFIGAGYSHRFR
jgi:hypothetical protein